MAKIQGYQGHRAKRIGIIQSVYCPKTKLREYSAVEKFSGTNSVTYIVTPIPDELRGKPEALNRFLESNRKNKGTYTTESIYRQSIKSSHAEPLKADRTAKNLHDYTYEIAGDLHRKRPAQIKSIIRRHDAANAEFMSQVWN